MTPNDRYIALVALGDAAGIWDMQNYGSAIGFSGVIFSMYVAVWAKQAGRQAVCSTVCTLLSI